MDKKKIVIIIICIVVVLSGIVIFANLKPGKNENSTPSEIPQKTEEIADKASEKADNSETEKNSSTSETPKASEKATDKSNDKSASTGAPQGEEQKTVKPTFMYFVSEKDDGYAETKKMIDELMKKYPQVVFDIRNVDEDPSQLEHFPVENQTPALFMLNTKNDICAFEFKCSDITKLEDDIKKSLE